MAVAMSKEASVESAFQQEQSKLNTAIMALAKSSAQANKCMGNYMGHLLATLYAKMLPDAERVAFARKQSRMHIEFCQVQLQHKKDIATLELTKLAQPVCESVICSTNTEVSVLDETASKYQA